MLTSQPVFIVAGEAVWLISRVLSLSSNRDQQEIFSDLGAPDIRDADAFWGVCKTSVSDMKEIFFESESLGTNVVPRCGGCRCGKCPVPGSQFSFKEQQEHDVIAGNLIYNEAQKRWFTSYPWLCPRSALSKNDGIAYQSLMSLEKNFRRNRVWPKLFWSR